MVDITKAGSVSSSEAHVAYVSVGSSRNESVIFDASVMKAVSFILICVGDVDCVDEWNVQDCHCSAPPRTASWCVTDGSG